MNKSVSIILPFYNEQEAVEDIVSDLFQVFRGSNWEFEIVCVQNGSTDKTEKILNSLQDENSEVRIVNVPTNLGYGYGVRKGLEAATKDIVGYLDGDGQIMAIDAKRILEEMKDGGAIKAIREAREDSFWRRFISFFYNLLFRLFFGLPWKDLNAKPKFFQRKDLERLRLASDDWFIDAEIMIKSKSLDIKWQESEMTFYKRKGGASSVCLSSILESLSNFFIWRFCGKIRKWKSSLNR